MKNITQMILIFLIGTSLCACSSFTTNQAQNETQWDFDHNVKFIQTQLNKNKFRLEIIPNNSVNFEQLAALLLRESHHICGSYHYKIEIIQGVEGFDDERAMPNYIMPSLVAKIECK